MKKEKLKQVALFENKEVRRIWDEEKESWYFSVADVVQVLTDSEDVKQYIKKMRSRDNELSSNWGTICTLLRILSKDGKMREENMAQLGGIFRIIQSIPSSKAEPFKQWLAKVGQERVEETEDPELAFERAMRTYLRKGYSKEWINQRLKSIDIRKELTDEWRERDIKEGVEFAILTDEITKAWAGKSVREYKKFKDLKKENLRDNMTNLELVLTMLAEASTTEISKIQKPKGLSENKKVAQKGGGVAKQARTELEKQTGRNVIASKNSKQLRSGK